MSREQPLLALEHVARTYATADGRGLQILKDVNLAVMPGKSAAIVGPSGSGKSTLLNIIGALDQPTSGRVLLDGQDLRSLDETARADIRNRQIGFVFQLHHLLPQCNVLENVLVPSLVRPGARDAAQRARALLAEVNLSDRLGYMPGQLSGGERQRVAVVRAMINSPALLVADEPTGSLDRASAERLAGLLADMNRRHALTLVVVTHSSALAERMDMVFELVDGALVQRK
jgi:predicted ABC-type transport system involved in lysophospholipase L1 biosynthesis ATPase subunit